MKIIQASFFWRNDQPGGLGITFGAPAFTPDELEEMFNGQVLKDYLKHSDLALGSNVVQDYLDQLAAIAQAKQKGKDIPLQQAILAARNIVWLTERGFIPQDEFNGTQYVKSK